MKDIVLLSGGLDSAVTAWMAKATGAELYALSFAYGQKHSFKELYCAGLLSEKLGVKAHRVVSLPIGTFGDSSLVDSKQEIPTEGKEGGIPSTWVPQRNSLFLTIAFGLAETLGASNVWIGANAVDYSGYPDCRPAYFEAMRRALNLGSKQYVEGVSKILIKTPVIAMTKAEEVRIGTELGVPFELTWSCYQGRDVACGVCDSCRIRLRAFEEAGMVDPIPYELA